MRISLVYILFILSSVCSFANEKADIKNLNTEAEEAFYDKNYRKAIDLFFKLDSIDPIDHAYYTFQTGLCYLYSNLDNSLALYYLEESYEEMKVTDIADMAAFSLAQAYHTNYLFDDAIEKYQEVLKIIEGIDDIGMIAEINRQIEICNNAKIIVEQEDYNAKIKSAGNSINSEYPDYKAVVTADESKMFFTARKPGSTGDKVDYTGSYYEDIYVTERDPFGYWDYPVQVSDKINSALDEATIGISVDGTEMYIYKGNVKGGEIFVTKLDGTEWSEPTAIEGDVNTKYWETSATISADGKDIYFTSAKKGGQGARDLYTCTFNETNNEWTSPKNLGSTINTKYDEDTPFIHPDGKTLYFSSRGHNTIGGFDIFKTVLENGEWSLPVNMGYPINSTCDDFHFVANARGSQGYFSSSRNDGRGEQDIYSVKLSGGDVPLLLVRGNIVTDKPEEQIETKMILTDKSNNEGVKTIYQPNKETGKYLIILPPSREYEMTVQAEGYPDYTTTIVMPNVNEYHEFYQQIFLQNGEIAVNNLFYDLRDSSLVSDTSLIFFANANNKDYLETLTRNIVDEMERTGANSINEITSNELVDQVFEITDPISEELEIDEEEEALIADSVGNKDNVNTSETNNTSGNPSNSATTNSDGTNNNNNTSGNPGNSATTNSDGTNNNSPAAEFTFSVKFPYDKFELEEKYKNDVEVIYSTYKRHTEAYLEISGHTDSKGSDAYNKVLSKKRAETIAAMLKAKGVPADHISVIAMGESQPKSPNVNPDGSDNPEGRSENRRTEVKIVNH